MYYGVVMDCPDEVHIDVAVNDDDMAAYLTLRLENGKDFPPLKSDILREALRDRGVMKGIDEKALEDIASGGTLNEKVLVAKAVAPKDGSPGSIYVEVKPKERSTYDRGVDAEKRVDHYGEREGFITYVRAGQVIAGYVPPAKGEPGFTVTGKIIEAEPGKDITFSKCQGKNTKIVGDKLIAEREGILLRDEGTFSVMREIAIDGDLGIKTGSVLLPLEADIDLTIGGDIKSGFTVQCRNIVVYGSVEDATVTAKVLDVKKGIVGTSAKTVTADLVTAGYIAGTRRIKAKYLQVAREISGGSRIEADFVRSSIIQECSVTVKYGVWTDYLFGGNRVWAGVNIEESAEYRAWSARLADIEKTLGEMKEKSLQLLKKEDSVRAMASRMPNNPVVQKEWMKITEAKENIAKAERAKQALEQKIREHMEKMFFDGSAFILVRLGFVKPTDKKSALQPVNELKIRDFSYDKSRPLTPGIFLLKDNAVVHSKEYALKDFQELAEKYRAAAMGTP